MSQGPRRILIPVREGRHAAIFEWFMQTMYKERDEIMILYCSKDARASISKEPVRYTEEDYLDKLTCDGEEEVIQMFQTVHELCVASMVKVMLLRAHSTKPGETIVQLCQEYKMDMIVMGGSRMEGKNVHNNMTMYVSHHCRSPVIVVKKNYLNKKFCVE